MAVTTGQPDAPAYAIDDLLADGDLTGVAWCEARTSRTDAYLLALYGAAGSPAGTALVALGGYGRGDLCPESDLDVALVHAPGVDVGGVADRIWYPVWDAGLKLGHQVGTVDQILERVVEFGANRIHGLEFLVEDRRAAESAAREKAAADARAKAEELARLHGMKLGKVVSVSEVSSGGPGPLRMERALMASADASITSPGERTVLARLSVVYSIR